VLRLHPDYGTQDIGYDLDWRLTRGIGTSFFERVEDLGVGSFWRSFRRGERTLGFAGTGVLPRLKKLRCQSTFIAAHLRLITESDELSQLEELHLQRESHTSQPFDLAPLLGETKLASLRLLSLGQHVVSAETARQLVRSPFAAGLEVLDLRGNSEVAPIAADLRKEWDGVLLA